MIGLHPLDIVVLIGYLLVILAIGLWTSRKVKNTGDFFIGGALQWAAVVWVGGGVWAVGA